MENLENKTREELHEIIISYLDNCSDKKTSRDRYLTARMAADLLIDKKPMNAGIMIPQPDNANYSIKITGEGTREEIAKALQLIQKAVNPITMNADFSGTLTDIDGAEWEDCTLMTEISKAPQDNTEYITFREAIRRFPSLADKDYKKELFSDVMEEFGYSIKEGQDYGDGEYSDFKGYLNVLLYEITE